MEQTPRITSIYEVDRERSRRERFKKHAKEQAANARKNAFTALALIRMMFQLAVTPTREIQGRIIRNNQRVIAEGRRVASGDRDRVVALGRSVLASR